MTADRPQRSDSDSAPRSRGRDRRIIGDPSRKVDSTDKPVRPRRLFHPWIGLAFLVLAGVALLAYYFYLSA